MSEPPVTWRRIADVQPEFVQWVVAAHGPLPDGPVIEADYVRLYVEYVDRRQR